MAEKNGTTISLKEWLKDTMKEVKETIGDIYDELKDIRQLINSVDTKVEVLRTTVRLKTGVIAIIVGSIPSVATIIWVLIRFKGVK